MNKFFAAFDTSNYTTSFALCSQNGEIVRNSKKLLTVPAGQRGLRQSDAVFQHTAAVDFTEESISAFNKEFPDSEIAAVGASVRPRDAEGSYMPCFLVGAALGRTAAKLMKVPFYGFSHQAGHIMAALYSSKSTDLVNERFAAFHVSGGTTDILLSTGFEKGSFKIERIGGTLDLNAGQVIDRTGVAMGLAFPAGAELEKLALENTEKIPRYPIKITGLDCNLSGIENKAVSLYEKTKDKRLAAAYTLCAVGDVLSALSENLLGELGKIPIVYSGGVMSCSILQKQLSRYSGRFAAPEFSSDNAAGCALLTRLLYKESQNA